MPTKVPRRADDGAASVDVSRARRVLRVRLPSARGRTSTPRSRGVLADGCLPQRWGPLNRERLTTQTAPWRYARPVWLRRPFRFEALARSARRALEDRRPDIAVGWTGCASSALRARDALLQVASLLRAANAKPHAQARSRCAGTRLHTHDDGLSLAQLPAPPHRNDRIGRRIIREILLSHPPAHEIDVVEINPHVVALRNEFCVPPDDERFRCIWATVRLSSASRATHLMCC